MIRGINGTHCKISGCRRLRASGRSMCKDCLIADLTNRVVSMGHVLEMVKDNSKMPHQHTDLQTRLYCLAERAREVLGDKVDTACLT